jgi:hypothetical protein
VFPTPERIGFISRTIIIFLLIPASRVALQTCFDTQTTQTTPKTHIYLYLSSLSLTLHFPITDDSTKHSKKQSKFFFSP